MNRYIILLLINFYIINVWSQQTYNGTVYDVGTRNPIPKVSILGSNSNISIISNESGNYSINIKYNNNTPNNQYFYIANNAFYYKLENATNIELFTISGASIFSKRINKKGIVELPVPPMGYYILVLEIPKNRKTLFLFSNGKSIFQVKKNNTSDPIIQSDSSLIFSKDNYFSREVVLDKKNKISNVNLLRNKYDSLDYFNELIRQEAFDMLQSSPPVSNFGEVQSIKALYNFKNDTMYYANVKKYPSHYSFAKNVLGFKGLNNDFFHSQYNDTPNRFLNLATINYFKNIDKYVFEFGSYDKINCDGIKNTYQKLLKTSYLKNNLYFYPSNQSWENCLEIPMISSEELFFGQNYQALNLADGYGFLRKVNIEELSKTKLGRHDIVLLNDVPNDLSVVSGIITTKFQTALSHINILSHNRKTPNMVLKDGWHNPKLDTLIGDLVYLKVESDSFIIRRANIDEASTYWNKKEPQNTIVLERDTSTSGIIDLNQADITSTKLIGGKAANFAELVNLGSIPVPENYFAIPFYYYQQHIKQNQIDTFIRIMLQDSIFKTDIEYRETKLKILRNIIKHTHLNPELIAAVKNKINNFKDFTSFRFRSSTNAEDLEDFNGAGLYDSYSAKKGHSKKTIENAIKKVWASLWNLRAFDEREYYKIDHNSIAMGILVHRSFPDEDANGVIITKNLYNVNHGYIFNVQYKEYSIVYPEPGILHDQIITYTFSLDNKDYTIEYLTHSNIPELNGETVLTDDEIYQLAEYCTIIKKHYFYDLPHSCNCEYNDFALDLEIKVDSQVEERKIYIKQVRIYNSK